MKRLLSIFLTMCFVTLFLCSLSIVAFAADSTTDPSTVVSDYAAKNVTVNKEGKIVCTDQPGLATYFTSDPNDSAVKDNLGQVTVKNSAGGTTSVYYNKDQVNAMQTFCGYSKNNTDVSNKVKGMNAFNITANTDAASSMLSGFTGIISLILGIICTLIVLGMALFSSLDLCYIAFPVFRNKCEDAVQSGNGMLTKKDSNGDTQLRWITDDAQYAIKQGTVDNGKNPWTIYFKKRVISYIVLAIILFILLSGQIGLIAQIAVNVVKGIMNVVSGLAS